MPEEVLLEEFVGPPKRKVKVCMVVPSQGGLVIERMMELLDRQIQKETILLGAEVILTLTREEDRRDGVAFIEGGGVFGYFPAQRRTLITDQGTSLLPSIVKSLAFFEGNFAYSPDRRKDNLNAQVNDFVPSGRSAALLRLSAKKRK